MDKIRPQKRGDFRKQVHGARPGLFAYGWVPTETRNVTAAFVQCAICTTCPA